MSGFRSNVTSTLVDLVALSQACSESCSSVSSKESPKCREWADAGECSRNAAFMLKDTLWGMMPCAILEETWNISPPGAGVTRIRESDLPHRPVEECGNFCPSEKGEMEECEQWARAGECDRNPEFMLKKCASSCGSLKQDHWKSGNLCGTLRSVS